VPEKTEEDSADEATGHLVLDVQYLHNTPFEVVRVTNGVGKAYQWQRRLWKCRWVLIRVVLNVKLKGENRIDVSVRGN
jgi:hypothetical protein